MNKVEEAMNDAERRRQELLEQTRALYNDRRTIPAVHPRYANALPVWKVTRGYK